MPEVLIPQKLNILFIKQWVRNSHTYTAALWTAPGCIPRFVIHRKWYIFKNGVSGSFSNDLPPRAVLAVYTRVLRRKKQV